jgi:hypothetical protein
MKRCLFQPILSTRDLLANEDAKPNTNRVERTATSVSLTMPLDL